MHTRDRTDGPVWVGVDVGTQSVRTMIVDDGGTVLALGSAPLTSHRPDTARHEQDPDQWWEAVGTASRKAFALLGSARRQVGGLAICSTSGTVLLTDAEGDPHGPALMYDDARATAELAEIRRRAGSSQDLTGAGPYPDASAIQLTWALPKMCWLLRHAGAHGTGGSAADLRICHSADFVAGRLAGQPVDSDASHTLKSGYDLVGQRWDPELLGAAQVPPEMLPAVRVPGTTLGAVTAAAAAHTHIPAGTPVIAGMTDGCAAQIAAGALTPGSANAVLGTTLVLKGVSEQRPVDPGGAVYSHRHPDDGWLPGGASNVGARVVSERFGDHDLTALTRAARAFEPAGGVIYPLTVRGERFPFVCPDAVGFETGDLTEPAERFAATLQGVALIERLCFERLGAIGADIDGEVMITGGGTRSPYWNQLRADILGRTLQVPATAEPAFGMAVLAASAGGRLAERARSMVRTEQVFEPRPGMHERFSEPYEQLTAQLRARGYLEKTTDERSTR